ncbi:MAG: MBL fold metallo-hydrolase [Clostridia bacterium]|nr:MBL fold metallo-hydrolase [Clostridia bacterium]
MIKIQSFPLGQLQANCYFVTNTDSDVSLLIDTGAESFEVENKVNDFGSEKLKYILLTHGHYDHIGNVAAMKKRYPNAQIVIGEKEADFTHKDTLNLSLFFGGSIEHFTPDILVTDGMTLDFGNEKIKVLETPGHTVGGVCYIIGDNIFTGDTIMSQTTGRMDFPTGNSRDMYESVKKIAAIKENLNVYCGHGESSTLDYERKHNIFMGNCSYDDLY